MAIGQSLLGRKGLECVLALLLRQDGSALKARCPARCIVLRNHRDNDHRGARQPCDRRGEAHCLVRSWPAAQSYQDLGAGPLDDRLLVLSLAIQP